MADALNRQYTFRDAHRPTFLSGEYTLTSTLKVSVDHAEKIPGKPEQVKFWIAGERFSLAPADIQAVYPPEGSRGSYEEILPHIALARDTLPWERVANAQKAPWLALLLLNETETAQYKLQTIPLSQYLKKIHAESTFVPEPGQEKTDQIQVQVIELPASDIENLLPNANELPLLCHVRAGEGDGKLFDSVAMVVGKRLPSHGRNTVHLVSLENRYNSTGFNTAGQTSCTLISLKSWTFTCEAKDHPATESLDGLFKRLNADWLQLPSTLNVSAQAYSSQGFVPLPHRFRSGESGASWYSGALIPNQRRLAASDKLKFPARAADELLWYHEEVGMLNVTYAAAWELGRLLVMQNRRIFASLHAWRHRQIGQAYAAAAAAKNGPGCHLPQVQQACPCAETKPPEELTNWINSLRRLQGIPFRYLVADERLLPAESIRFFQVDPQWTNALVDGALSVARIPTEQNESCRSAEQDLLKTNLPPKLTGFLLRSAAVAEWSGLQVIATGANAPSLPLYQQVRQLSPSIMLCLFEGEFTTLTIQQPPATLHLSVESQTKNSSFWKDSTKKILNLAALNVTSASMLATTLLHHQQKLQVSVRWQ